jgi:hypothetical protein
MTMIITEKGEDSMKIRGGVTSYGKEGANTIKRLNSITHTSITAGIKERGERRGGNAITIEDISSSSLKRGGKGRDRIETSISKREKRSSLN